MNKHFQSYFLSTLLSLVLTAIICSLGGLIGTACSIMVSVLFGMQTTKYHYHYLIATSFLIFAVVAALGGVMSVFFIGIPMILIGLALGLATNVKLSLYKLIALCTGLTLADTLIRMSIMKNYKPEFYSMDAMIGDAYERSKSLLAVYNLDARSQELLNSYLQETVSLIRTLSPALFIIISIILSFITIMIFKRMMQKQDLDMSFLKPFYLLRADTFVSILFLFVLFLYSFAPPGMFFDAALNVITILGFIYFVFGLSFLDYKMKNKGVNKLTRRIILLCIIPATFIIVPYFIVASVGVADSIFNYRHKIKNSTDV